MTKEGTSFLNNITLHETKVKANKTLYGANSLNKFNMFNKGEVGVIVSVSLDSNRFPRVLYIRSHKDATIKVIAEEDWVYLKLVS